MVLLGIGDLILQWKGCIDRNMQTILSMIAKQTILSMIAKQTILSMTKQDDPYLSTPQVRNIIATFVH